MDFSVLDYILQIITAKGKFTGEESVTTNKC